MVLYGTRWKRELRKKLPNTGETVPTSDHTEKNIPHSEGMGLMLYKKADKLLTQCEGSFTITVTFRNTEKVKD